MLSRAAGRGRAAAPVRLVHLGLGNFFRAHQAWYTDCAPDAQEWGIAAFTGRGAELANALAAQEGLYTLITRAADGDRFQVVSSLSRAHAAADHAAWLGYFSSPEVHAITVTLLCPRAGDDHTDRPVLDRPAWRRRQDRSRDPQAEAGSRRALDAPGRAASQPGRPRPPDVARRRADAGALALVPCDNLPGNGAIAARVLHDLAEMVDPDLAEWLTESVSTVTTMVDRITPRTTPEDARIVAEATGVEDCCPVGTEPFNEWVLSGAFPGGRPRWEDAGATFTEDVAPFEHRKLWLLNGGHSLLAYLGSARGHSTVAEAVADETCRTWLERWWSEASRHLQLPEADVAAYRTALLERFANPRIHHRLDQIAADGSQKLPVRILPVLRKERSAGRLPQGATLVLAAWVCHLRGMGAPVNDARAEAVVPLAAGQLTDAVPRVLGTLDPTIAADKEVVGAVLAHCEQLEHQGRP